MNEADFDFIRQVFERVNRRHLEAWISDADPTFRSKLEFAVSRYGAGEDCLRVLVNDLNFEMKRDTAILDLGGGNGGVILPFAGEGAMCVSLDLFIHSETVEIVRETGLPVSLVSGVGEDLPFESGSFDVVLYVETIEHVQNANRVGREIARVLKPGGLCVVTTPPRARFVFRGDPHYGVRGIAALPNAWQRWIVERVARVGTKYEVSHLFWTISGIMKTLPDLRRTRVYSSARFRILKLFDWDLIVATKPTT